MEIFLKLFSVCGIILFCYYKTYKKIIVGGLNSVSYNISNSLNEVTQMGNILSRNKISLNGKWNYIVDVQEVGFYNYRLAPTSRGFFRNEKPKNPEDSIGYDFEKAPQIEIPSDWNTKDEKLFLYEGTVWFKKSFNYSKKSGKLAILYFAAINYEAMVYLNGIFIGRHEGGFTPFNYDITDKIKDGENFLIIKVNNQRKRENIPTLIFDWWNYGGIIRDVYIVQTDNIYIQNYHFYLEKKENKDYKKNINFKVDLNSKISGKKIEISIPELNIKEIFETDSNGKISGSINVNNLLLWSPENPKLYNIELKLENEILKDEIGFRIIETSGKKILLNDKPIFLRGVCIHDEKYNGGGRTNSPNDAKVLLGWAKELGCNFVRLAHYPHNEYMVREAEKMGLMVWSEIPVYWAIAWENDYTFENAKNQLTNMIYRDINRANVIIWSIANETPKSELRDKFLSKLSLHARSLDKTRLISMAMEFKKLKKYEYILEDNMNKFVDVLSINQYMGWYVRSKSITKIVFQIPYDKPVIMSEFGGGAKYGFHGRINQRWTEEFQENVYIQNLKMIDKVKGVAGTTPWILKDFRSPRRILKGIQDYYNRKGLYSDKGEKKKAFYVMKKYYEKKKKDWE